MLRSYQQGGNQALGEYRDKKNPARIAEQFGAMLQRASALPDVLPELRRYVLEYPNAALPGADSYFFWEKVDFGLKPTIRLNHAVIYRGRTQGRDFATVAIKQLYPTHYFQTALDVSVCVQDGAGDRPGFYLLTLKGSQQDGLTGVRGSLLRKAVVDKTRTSLERALASIKQTVERSAAGGRRPAADVRCTFRGAVRCTSLLCELLDAVVSEPRRRELGNPSIRAPSAVQGAKRGKAHGNAGIPGIPGNVVCVTYRI